MMPDKPMPAVRTTPAPPIKIVLLFVGATILITGLLLAAGASRIHLPFWKGDRWHVLGGSMTARWEEGYTRYEVKNEGEVVLTDDDRDIAHIEPGGYLIITEYEDGDEQHRLEITPDAQGTLKWAYRFQREEHPYDQQARAWLSDRLLYIARQSGIGAKGRVARIRAQKGVEGVLTEIRALESDGVKDLYFLTLTRHAPLNKEEWATTLRAVGDLVSSDGHKDHVLTEMLAAEADWTDPDVQEAFYAAYRTMASDGHKDQTLLAFGTRYPVNREILLRAVQDIDSDGHQGHVLTKLLPAGGYGTPELQTLFLDTFQTIQSDGHKQAVLAAIWDQPDFDPATLLRAAGMIDSDGHQATVLMRSDKRFSPSALQSLFLDTFQTIQSDGHKQAVLAAIWDQPDFDPATLLRAAGMIDSDGHQATVLMRSDKRFSAPALQPLFLEVFRTVQSDGHKVQVLNALWDQEGYDKATLLEAVRTIQSDGNKTAVLDQMASESLKDPRLRPLFIDAVRTVQSSGHASGLMRRILDTE